MSQFSKDVLKMDYAKEAARIEGIIRETVVRKFKKQGAVIGVSGGIDSTVVATLCTRALGKSKVHCLHMPEADSSKETLGISRGLTDWLGVESTLEEMTPSLSAIGCYRRRDEAIKEIIPAYGAGWKFKIVLPQTSTDGYRLYSIVAQSPEGKQITERLPLKAYLTIVASTNFKQRTRKMLEYFHADRLNYAVAGTPNRLEYELGFFVKNGDGAADLKPIAHLYKKQVYEMAAFLGVPENIRNRPPTTDTYSLAQSQDEFYWALPWQEMDMVLYAYDHKVPAEECAKVMGKTTAEIERGYKDVEGKRNFARYLAAAPVLMTESHV